MIGDPASSLFSISINEIEWNWEKRRRVELDELVEVDEVNCCAVMGGGTANGSAAKREQTNKQHFIQSIKQRERSAVGCGLTWAEFRLWNGEWNKQMKRIKPINQQTATQAQRGKLLNKLILFLLLRQARGKEECCWWRGCGLLCSSAGLWAAAPLAAAEFHSIQFFQIEFHFILLAPSLFLLLSLSLWMQPRKE